MSLFIKIILAGFFLGGPLLGLAIAEEQYVLNIKNHQFEPAQLTIPAGKKIKLTVDNQDPTAEEFESFELDREKEVDGGKQTTIYLGPLKPGSYKYYGDFNPKTAQGVIVVK